METNNFLPAKDKGIYILSGDDLIRFVSEITLRLQKETTPSGLTVEIEQPINQQEAVKFLGRSRQTLIAWRKKGFIQAYRISGRIYYMRSELVAALEKLG